jgi:hydrogenase maturation protease
MTSPHTLVIGCGNTLRGDDAAGPELVRRLRDRGLPPHVGCVDAGTGGLDVALHMRNIPEVILVDACRSVSEPGSLFEVSGAELEAIPPPAGLNLHAFRWNHALALARCLLADEYPDVVTAYLVEGERFDAEEGLSPAVSEAIDRLADLLLCRLASERDPGSACQACPSPPREP